MYCLQGKEVEEHCRDLQQEQEQVKMLQLCQPVAINKIFRVVDFHRFFFVRLGL